MHDLPPPPHRPVPPAMPPAARRREARRSFCFLKLHHSHFINPPLPRFPSRSPRAGRAFPQSVTRTTWSFGALGGPRFLCFPKGRSIFGVGFCLPSTKPAPPPLGFRKTPYSRAQTRVAKSCFGKTCRVLDPKFVLLSTREWRIACVVLRCVRCVSLPKSSSYFCSAKSQSRRRLRRCRRFRVCGQPPRPPRTAPWRARRVSLGAPRPLGSGRRSLKCTRTALFGTNSRTGELRRIRFRPPGFSTHRTWAHAFSAFYPGRTKRRMRTRPFRRVSVAPNFVSPP
mmetsp:Transcript_1086/g.4133  ORF Transcript_1086/g.4133 Transcript_1086/m.4133 type:complete len:283 (+) Transcript_1086:357-1205(+)